MSLPKPRNYHIAWIDIVKSTAKGATSVDQKKKIETLIKLIRGCKAFENALVEAKKKKDRKWWLWSKDTGDGYCLCFSESVAEPYDLAIELQGELRKYNKERVDEVVMGLLKKKEKFGEVYCPCRVNTGDKEKDEEIICPCVFHRGEIELQGHCLCFLFTGEKKFASSK